MLSYSFFETVEAFAHGEGEVTGEVSGLYRCVYGSGVYMSFKNVWSSILGVQLSARHCSGQTAFYGLQAT